MSHAPPSPKQIFLEAIEKPSSEELARYLDQACQGDAELRGRVEQLLRGHQAAGQFLGGLQGADATQAPSIGERAGMQIGRYKLLQQIGEGGMGVVYMAEQKEPVERRVALKIIKPGMDTRQVIARFEAERQALAMMDHPNIAKVFDAGTTNSEPGGVSLGSPYFVMELVHGITITRYCDEHHLTLKQRLELFLPVCQAVQHAHQKGIIHRDLKPSNVLIAQYDDKPVPKVIDFGVAKAAQKLTDRTMFTEFGQVVGTLEYMSPEQATFNQLDIDTRSDIYSLGVLLYELLTGCTPFDGKRLRSAAFDEMLRIIREEEPPKPSTRLSSTDTLPSIAANRNVEPARLGRSLRGELDWIVMKALEKDRNRRYETTTGLARDIERYLSDEPVVACPPSAVYRFRKFARRNKGGLAVAALVLFFLILIGSGAGWAWRDRSARAADAARQRGERQAKAAGQVESIFAEVDSLEGEQKWPEALATARRAEAIVNAGEVDASTAERVGERLKDLLFIERLEQIRMRMATLIEGKLDYAGANREYIQAFRDYGVDVDELTVETSVNRLQPRPKIAIALAAALDAWAYSRRGMTEGHEEDIAAWKRQVDVARGIDPDLLRNRIRAAQVKPIAEVQDELLRLAESIDIQAQHPATLFILAGQLNRVKRLDAELRLLRDAQRVYPADFWLNVRLGWRLEEAKDHEGATRFNTAALAIRPKSVAVLNNLGNSLNSQRKFDEAVAAYQEAIELDSKSAFIRYNLGSVLFGQKKFDEAVAAYREAVKLDSKYALGYNGLGNGLREQKKLDDAITAHHKAIELDPNLATAHNDFGLTLLEKKMVDDAIAAYRKAIELDPTLARPHSNLGNALRQQNKLEEAVAECNKAVELDPKFVDGFVCLGGALLVQKKLDEAEAALRKAIELDPKSPYAFNGLGNVELNRKKLHEATVAFLKAIEFDPTFAPGYMDLGVALLAQKKLDKAEAALRKAIELDPKYALAYCNLGRCLAAQNEMDKAITAYRMAIKLEPKSACSYHQLGLALGQQNKFKEAEDSLRKAIELDPKSAAAHSDLGAALSFQNRPDEAEVFIRQALELDPKSAAIHNNLGLALAAQNKLDEAISAHRQAIELDPAPAGPYFDLGQALAQQRKFDQSEAALWKAIERDPKFPSAHNVLGFVLIEQNRLDEAIAAFRRAIELNPNDAAARGNLAAALAMRGWQLANNPDSKLRDPERAIDLASEAVRLTPQMHNCWITIGVAHYRAGDWKAAIAALEKSTKLRNGGNSFDWFPLAMAHWQLDEKDKARGIYDRAVKWMEENQPTDEELRRFRIEAVEVMELEEKK